MTGDELREAVRRRYAAAARAPIEEGCGPTCCGVAPGGESPGGEPSACPEDAAAPGPASAREAFGPALYGPEARDAVPAAAMAASLGCGVPTAVADLREGETVLDLGSGAGADVLLSARRVGPAGRAIGIDMTDEMLELSRANARAAEARNVEFLRGCIEELPLADASVDVVISNCVINLSVDKPCTLREAARVLRPGGRLAVSDVVVDPDVDEADRREAHEASGCIAGALTAAEFERTLGEAGLVDVEVIETHRVHRRAAAAVIRARKPRAG